MHLGTAQHDGRLVPVAVEGESLRPLGVPSLLDLIRSGEPAPSPAAEPLADARLTAPIRPGKIVAIGLNYLDHIREQGIENPPERPIVFTKFPSSVIGDSETIELDRSLTERADWEVELAVVIGWRMRRVPAADALSYMFGYTVANDVSARDVQFADHQWVRGKSLDTFCPLGPVIVTADELPEIGALALRTRVNGELVQDSSTSEMLFGVPELLAFCSASFPLDPGDILLTGTPWGCGEFMDPVRSLQDGDVVECEVEGIGTLTNPVAEIAPAPSG
ncbi:MAG TPA: fumarylacetoacetate hydrolase family protein [Solirubrobacterales bacterium]|nr:fumarylacetoacetate hydrolase family protein [Solirubrobacterales bacterium]